MVNRGTQIEQQRRRGKDAHAQKLACSLVVYGGHEQERRTHQRGQEATGVADAVGHFFIAGPLTDRHFCHLMVVQKRNRLYSSWLPIQNHATTSPSRRPTAR